MREHLVCVAKRAEAFALEFSAGESARLAGLLHDLGKFADQFQRRVRGAREQGKDHWTAGSLATLGAYGWKGLAAALCIEGHHEGLGTLCEMAEYKEILASEWKSAPDRFTHTNLGMLVERHKSILGALPSVGRVFEPAPDAAAGMLDVRMLFSCLVDADFIETEAHFEGDATTPRRYRPSCPPFDFKRGRERLDQHVANLSANSDVSEELRKLRGDLFESCRRAGRTQAPGIFTLTAPTGAGKTLAMLGFALEQVLERGLSRVVVVMPFLNILDQTVRVYRDLFSEEAGFAPACILEDHSLADLRDASDNGLDSENNPETSNEHRLRRLLAENWDAPIVLTTSVKFLESLHANRPGPCRKLHRLAKSAILFDEVQTLPPALAVPTLASLSHLSARYGSTVLFSTATQPAFDHLNEKVKGYSSSGWQPRSILPDPMPMFEIAGKRVDVDWELDSPVALESLAEGIAGAGPQVLCIVNVKRHASRLAELLLERQCEGVYHLSTNMCAVHRQRVLECVGTDLKDSSQPPVLLVATQCVEAGVDLDFPVVYRAVGPLEAIAQAAGRCNRHDARPSRGQVRVFLPEDETYPPGAYRMAAQTTKVFLRHLRKEVGETRARKVLYDPEAIARYYRTFYDLTAASEGYRELLDAVLEGSFRKVAELYQVIPAGGINILVPYAPEGYQTLREEAAELRFASPGVVRRWMARARPHAIGIHRPRRDDTIWCYLEPVILDPRGEREPVWFVCLDQADSSRRPIYDRNLVGLRTDIEFSGVV
ncbi:MAG: CRISPR-associated endonuclease Cas3'' [Phycisphaerae bacterium]|nr:CRISPR-associated endonuclease Cas3'' [Phycisphaerae bacterium]